MKALIAMTAMLGLVAAPAIAGDTVNWTGPYLGVHAGYGWGGASTKQNLADWCTVGDSACIAKFVGPFNYDTEGVFGGVTAGYNHMIGNIVIGPEAEVGYMDITGARMSDSSNPIYHQDHSVDGGLYGLIAARVGLAFGKALVYGKGGYAWIDGDQSVTTTKPGYATIKSDSLQGWAYGGGLEYAIGHGWSVKGEYLRINLDDVSAGQKNVGDPSSTANYVFGNSTQLDAIDTVKLGVIYRFGDDAAPLK